MWCMPHPRQPGHTLVLLDTEGLGDVDKGDTKNDTWIFVLAVLLSSTLIYNSKGTIDQQALENLHYVLTLTECIKLTKSPEENGAQPATTDGLAVFFPTFVWAVRDFTLQLQADGKEISEDEYLENALKLRGGSSPEAERYDRLRECIRQFFPQRRCFVFDQPASKRDLLRLEELLDDRMDPEFLQQLEKFCSYIWEQSPPKSIPGGCKMTGEMLGTLAVTYVDAIQSGTVPCLESAVTALAELHNSAAVREAAALYQELMEQRAELPMETAEGLLELHEQCQRETLQLFAERAITDDVERFRAELLRQVEAARLHFCSRDEEASHEKCTAALQELYREMEQRINDGIYFVPGGHQLFLGDQQTLVERYRVLPGKGVKADAALQEFLLRMESLARSICSTDRALTEKDEQIKDLQAQNEKAEEEREAERQREAEKLRKMEDRIRRYEEAEEEWEAERQREAEKLRKMEDRIRRYEEAEEEWEAERQREAEKLQQMGDRIRRYEEAEEEWEAERQREAEKLQQMGDRIRRYEEAEEEWEAERQREAEKLQQMGDRIRRYEEAEEEWEAERQREAEKLQQMGDRIHRYEEAEEEWEAERQREAEKLQQMGDRIRRYEEAEEEWEAERQREAEKLQQMEDRIHRYEEAEEEWEAERQREAEKLQQMGDRIRRYEEAEEEWEAERQREAEKLQQMGDRIRRYEEAEEEWEAERQREAEKLRKMEDRARRCEEEAFHLRKRLWPDEEKKSHSNGWHSGSGSQETESGSSWIQRILAVLWEVLKIIFYRLSELLYKWLCTDKY
eukprot:XP_025002287.1 guanylate-binding protein 1 isoform X2 [Gallus gallus]